VWSNNWAQTGAFVCGLQCALPVGINTTLPNGFYLSGNLASATSILNGGTVIFVCVNSFNGLLVSTTATCAAGGTTGVATWAPFTPTVTSCQPVNGGIGFPVLYLEAGLTASVLTLQQVAGQVTLFSTATSTLTAVAIAASADARLRQQPVSLQNGWQHTVVASNCATAVCVQNVINYWRCKGLTVDCSGFTCWFNQGQIACPTAVLGWSCPRASKKTLLLLLLLLILIPVVLCSSLLCLLCLLRRKKTGGDVHFATFDPSAGPALGPVVAGTLGGCGGMGGMPMGSVPVAF